jgi:coenzyme F420-dependent glucose-6-phosphate dehydrogenase
MFLQSRPRGDSQIADMDAKGERIQKPPLIGYWCAHEQYSMHSLLDFVIEAEKGGFTSTMTSDHFHPWWNDNAFGNFTWVWLAAAAERTRKMKFVTGVTSPVYRYHPAIIAQSFASLDTLYPGRIALGLGTGEALNEMPLGFNWPCGDVRLERTKEALKIIRSLWRDNEERKEEINDSLNSRKSKATEKPIKIDSDGFVSYNGTYYKLSKAKLYTPPVQRIPLYFAAAAMKSTQIAAAYSDGLVTFLKAEEAEPLLRLFDKTAKAKGRNISLLEKIVEYKVSYDEDYEKALQSSMFWRATMIKNVFNSKLSDPRELEERAKKEVSEETVKRSVHITTSIEDCIKLIETYVKAGFTRVYVHSTSPNEIKFIKTFCQKIIPYFAKSL